MMMNGQDPPLDHVQLIVTLSQELCCHLLHACAHLAALVIHRTSPRRRLKTVPRSPGDRDMDLPRQPGGSEDLLPPSPQKDVCGE
jgi:hypothetical protein